MFKRAVIGSFRLGRKAASGKLSALEMILDAFTADSRSGTSAVAARAFLLVLVLLALH